MNANLQSQEYENIQLQEGDISIPSEIPNVYVRSSEKADKEIDLLWSEASQRNAHKEDRAPGVYLAIGFLAGLLVMFFMMSLLGPSVNKGINLSSTLATTTNNTTQNKIKNSTTLTTTPATASNKYRDYVIQEGDSLEKICRKFYGKYAPDLVDKIQKANNLDSPHKIRAGKALIIPL